MKLIARSHDKIENTKLIKLRTARRLLRELKKETLEFEKQNSNENSVQDTNNINDNHYERTLPIIEFVDKGSQADTIH
ncbi:hypothetical protein FQR65_LT17533 [Abscondita terminalis]|nr:hypothetical protein FQR65_LT17533 [Abscondita terminalis]